MMLCCITSLFIFGHFFPCKRLLVIVKLFHTHTHTLILTHSHHKKKSEKRTTFPFMKSWIRKTMRKVQLRSFVSLFLVQPNILNTIRHSFHNVWKLRSDIRRLRLILLQVVETNVHGVKQFGRLHVLVILDRPVTLSCKLVSIV